MNPTLRRSSRWGLVLWILGFASATLLVNRKVQWQRHQLQALHTELSAIRAAQSAQSLLHSTTLAELESLNAALHSSTSSSSTSVNRNAQAQNPVPDWSQPPDSLPEWNPDSPYIWLTKDSVAKLTFTPFDNAGALDSSFAEILGIAPSVSQKLNSNLEDTLHRYQVLETERAILSNELSTSGSIKITIPAMPLETARIKAEFNQVLAQTLGAQRADLLVALGRDWIAERFSAVSSGEKTYVVKRAADGAYSIEASSGGTFRGFSGPRTLEGFIPHHLLPFFNELNPPQPETNP